jgi:hypothetical protein
MGKSKKNQDQPLDKSCTYLIDGNKCEDECTSCLFEERPKMEVEEESKPTLLLQHEDVVEVEPKNQHMLEKPQQPHPDRMKRQTGSQTQLKAELMMQSKVGKLAQRYCQYRTRYN